MAQINWPSIAIGSGTGTVFTDANRIKWIWKGDAWEELGNSYRGYPQPWVKFNFSGVAYVYPTLTSAMNNAFEGETIHLFGNVTENPGVYLQNKVNINLNGHTLTFNSALGFPGFQSGSSQINCKISNGVITNTGGSTSPLISNLSPLSSYEFEGVSFIHPSGGAAGEFNCNVKGGYFYSNSGSAFRFLPDNGADLTRKHVIVENVYAESNSSWGFEMTNNYATIVTATFKNITGITNLSTAGGIVAQDFLSNTGRPPFSFESCVSISYAFGGDGSTFYANRATNTKTRPSMVLNDCYSLCVDGVGLRGYGVEMHNCVAEGSVAYIIPFCDAYGCTYSGPTIYEDGGYETRVTAQQSTTIDNCSFEGLKIEDLATSPSNAYHKIKVQNSTIPYLSVMQNSTATILEVKNSVLGIVGPATSENFVLLSGATGSEFVNNSFIGSPSTRAFLGVNLPKRPAYFVSNTILNCFGTDFTNLASSTISTKGNVIY